MNPQQQDPTWDLTIKPKRHLFDINLKELWEFRDLIGLFVRRDFVAKYKQTILGPLWFLIQPLFQTLMYTLVFGKIAKLSTDDLPQMLFYMAGIVPWTYFSQSLNMTSKTFVENAKIFGKVYFPRLAVPVSIVISNMIQFIIQFLFLWVFMVIYWIKGFEFGPNIYLLLLPVLLILLAGLGLGFGIIISSLTTKYRDLTNLVAFGVQLWMYATPVIYPLSSIEGKMRVVLMVNPLTGIVETFKTIMLGVGEIHWGLLGYSAGFCLVVLGIGVLLFNKIEQNFMDTV
ncbi:MAG: ABC transporter permease [Bacteroidales bacterium]|nr:ABC transporter permease [Bacteroidales bacterium]